MQDLGDYRILEELGRGGMGVVYKAQDQKLGRLVAVKLLTRGVASDPKRFARFEREAKGAAAVVHPSITTIHAFGDANGSPYMVFEFMAGGSLDRRLRMGPIPWREALALAAPVARGLAAIHAAGFVHRDVKPANILLDAAGRPKIGDFGLVRHLETQRGSLTGANELIGTVAYLAPEQTGEGSIDFRADLYALGATLYALLTGRPPFLGEGIHVISQHLTAKPSPPSEEAEGVPPEVDALVLRLLAKKPGERGASADAIADEIEQILAGKQAPSPTVATVPPPSGRTPIYVGGAVGLVVVAVAAVLLLRGPPPSLAITITEPLEGAAVTEGTPVRVRGNVQGAAKGVWLKANDRAMKESSFELDLLPVDGKITVTVDGSDGTHATKTVGVKAALPGWFSALRVEEKPRSLPARLRPAVASGVYRWALPDGSPLELVFVPATTFAMGVVESVDYMQTNSPLHQHRVAGYWIGRYEVTWAQYGAFCAKTQHKPAPRPEWLDKLERQPEHPVVSVTWNDAHAFCEWAGLRLPTEPEWEHAARGPEDLTYPWGNEIDANSLGNFNDKSCPNPKEPQDAAFRDVDDRFPYTAPIGSIATDRSPFGAFDMGGNVAEFCEDWYDPEIYKTWKSQEGGTQTVPRTPPLDGKEKKVVRGGSWAFPSWSMKASSRGNSHTGPGCGGTAVGFRVALSEP